MATKAPIRKAVEDGRAHAREVLRARRAALRRARAAKGAAPRRGPDSSAGTLLAEGDSWFDYPFSDVLKELEDGYAYEVECVAQRGDAIEEMAYGGGQLDELIRRLEKLARQGTRPRAILLSGGGNDIAGEAFAMIVNHVGSPIAGLSSKVLDGVVDERIRLAYAHILASVTAVAEQVAGARIPILVHGYDYPVPDGRGYWGGWGPLPGPWLEPGFREKGFASLPQRVALAKVMIDRFNAMLAALVRAADFRHVTYVDLRGTLSTGGNYKDWWDNELHPTARGFNAVAQRFDAVLRSLP